MQFKQVQDEAQCRTTTIGANPAISDNIIATMPADSVLWIVCDVKAASADHAMETSYHTFCRRRAGGPVIVHEIEVDRIDPEGHVKDWKKVVAGDADGNVRCTYWGQPDPGSEVDWMCACHAFLGTP